MCFSSVYLGSEVPFSRPAPGSACQSGNEGQFDYSGMYWTLERSSEIFRKPRKIFETRAPGASAQCPRECFCFLSVRVMRRVETVRNNSRGRFVEKLDTDHSIDPRPQDDVRGSTKLNTQNGFSSQIFFTLVGIRWPPRTPSTPSPGAARRGSF